MGLIWGGFKWLWKLRKSAAGELHGCHSGARSELRCAIARRRISRFRVRCFASPRN